MWGKTESLDQSESSTSHSNATHLQGVEISSETPFENGQFLKYNGSIWIPSIITLSNIRSSVTNNSALSTTCNSNQTLNYNSISDSFECSTISINASQITQGVLPITFGGTGASTASEAVNNLLPSQTSNGGKFLATDGTNLSWSSVSSATNQWITSATNIYYSLGNVGIGTTNPGYPLDILSNNSNGDREYTQKITLNLTADSFNESAAIYSLTNVNSTYNNVANAVDGWLNLNTSSLLNTGIGVSGHVANLSSGLIAYAMGITGDIQTFGGTVTNAIAGNFYVSKSGLGINSNAIGVYVGTIQGTTKHSIYTSDPTAPNYFAGSVGIGTSQPSSTLEVTGNIALSTGGNRTIQVEDSSGANANSLTLASGSVTSGGSFKGGNLTLLAGSGLSTGAGGDLSLYSGSGGPSGLSGSLSISTGVSNNAGTPGAININGGLNGTGVGGAINIQAGIGVTGGELALTGGQGLSTSNGGNIVLNGGTPFSTGTFGNIILANSGGKVGIGNIAIPAYLLDVNGDINIAGANALLIGGASICTIAGCTPPSDQRLKENIKPLNNSLNKILKLQGVSYDWKNKEKFGNDSQIGFIAQDVEKTFPQVVMTDQKTGFKSLAYDHLVAPLVEAFKELLSKLDNLDSMITKILSRISELESENEKLKKENTEFKTRLEKLEKSMSNK